MKKFLLIIFAIVSLLPLSARDFGDMSKSENRYRVTSKKSLNVRNSPGLNGQVLFSVSPGDYIYGYAVSEEWVKVNGSEWYLSSRYLAIESNPYYNQIIEVDENSYSAERVYRIQKIVRWCLLVACIIIFAILIFSFWDYIKQDLFMRSTKGKGFKSANGVTYFVRQKFYYGISSYTGVLLIALLVVASIISGVLALMLVGGTVWLLLAIVWVLLYILIIIGWILLVGGVLALFGGGETAGYGCGGILIGGAIVGYSDAISEFGESSLDAGFAFFRNLYVVDFVRDLVIIYWKPALIIVAIPLVLFILFVLANLIISGVFMLTEYIVMLRYNIKNPCPVCQHASEPAIYLSKGHELPVNLHPGRYGIFKIIHPITKESMPTMLFNGKDKLERKCKHCGRIISANMGTEKHLALAGVAESGKTALVYRMVAEILRMYPNSVSFTDVSQSDYDMMDSIQAIAKRGYMEHFPPKTEVGQRRAIQLKLQRGLNMFYRLFINDVGGELFSMSAVDKKSSQLISQFVRNVESIIFLVDPETIDFKGCDTSSEFSEWVNKRSNRHTNRIDIFEAFGRLMEFFSSQNMVRGRALDLHINVVLVKRDLGYLSNVDEHQEEALRGFMVADMGLGRLISDIENSFKSDKIHYLSFSAVGKTEPESNAGTLVNMLFRQLSIDNLKCMTSANREVQTPRAQRILGHVAKPEPKPQPAPEPKSEPKPEPKPMAAATANGELYDVVLIDGGPTKLLVLKTIKDIKNCSLTEAKDIVDLAPKVVVSALPKSEATKVAMMLSECDARVELRLNRGSNR